MKNNIKKLKMNSFIGIDNAIDNFSPLVKERHIRNKSKNSINI
jgi:hypothetical protein